MIRRLAFGLVGIAIIAVSGIAIANVLDNDLPGGNPVIVVPGVLGTFSPTEFQVLLQVNPVFQGLLLGRVSAKYDPVGAASPNRSDWQIHRTYSPWLERLEDEGYTPGVDLFVFPYDSMQSMNINASDLGELVDRVLADTPGIDKVDLVAHSMGGLVARTYVSSAGAKGKIDQLITFGTPHHGTPGAYLIWEGGTVERWFTGLGDWGPEEAIEQYLEAKAKTWLESYGIDSGWVFSQKEFRHGLFHALQEDGAGIGNMLPTDPYLIDRDTGFEKKNACSDQDAYPVNTFLCGLFDDESKDRLGAVDFVTVYSNTPKSTYVAFRVAPVDDPFHGDDTLVDEDHVNGPPPQVARQWRHGDPFKRFLGTENLDDIKGAGDGKIPAYSSEMKRDLDTAVDCPQPKLEHAELATKTGDLLLRILRRDECVPPLRVARLPRSEARTRPPTGTTDETPSEPAPEPVPVPDAESATPARKPNEPPTAAFEICYLEDCASTHGILTLPDDAVGDLRLIAQPTDPDDENLQVTWLVNGDPVNVSKGPPFAEVPWPIETLVPGDNNIQLRVTDPAGASNAAGITVVAARPRPIPVSLCRETLDFELPNSRFGGYSMAGDLNGDGTEDTVTVDVGVSEYDTEWPMTVRLVASDGTVLHQVGNLRASVLFGGVHPPLVMGGILDATGDGRNDVVLCLAGTFSAAWDVQVLVLTDHTGRWTTVLDESPTNGLVDIEAPALALTETVRWLAGACADVTTRTYLFAGSAFTFQSEEVRHEWSVSECGPDATTTTIHAPPTETTTSQATASALVDGTWDVTYTVTKSINIYDAPVGSTSHRVWEITYDCASASCDITATSTNPETGFRHATSVVYGDGVYRWEPYTLLDDCVDLETGATLRDKEYEVTGYTEFWVTTSELRDGLPVATEIEGTINSIFRHIGTDAGCDLPSMVSTVAGAKR